MRGHLTNVAWGGAQSGGGLPGGGIPSCPEGGSPFGGRGCGDSLFLLVRPCVRLGRGEAAACWAPSRPVGGEGGGVRWCPAPPPPRPPLPPSSPRAGLSLPSAPLSSPPSPHRLLLPLPLLWLLRHTPQSRRDRGAGPGNPPASACTPSDAQTCPPRPGGSPRSPTSASARLAAAPAVTGKEAAGSGCGGRAGSWGSARRAQAGEPRRPGIDLGRADSSTSSDSPSWGVEPGLGHAPLPGYSGKLSNPGAGSPVFEGDLT